MPFMLNRTKTPVSPNLQRILNGELSPLINIIINIPCTLKTLGKRRQMEY